MIFKKKSIWIANLLTLLILYGFSRLYFQFTDDFRLSNISHTLPFTKKWEIPILVPDEHKTLERLLSQTYTYAGKGSQSYVFMSDDHSTVLKFFKFKHLRPSALVTFIPSLPYLKQWKAKEIQRKNVLLNRLFNGYHLAFTEHREQSALIFLHLNIGDSQLPHVQIIDKIGIRHAIDLNTVPFIVQKVVRTTRDLLSELLAEGNLSEAKIRIRQIIDLYREEYQQGMYDADPGLKTNTGFVGQKAVRIDLGKLTKNEKMRDPKVYRQDLKKVLSKFMGWIQRIFSPEVYQELNEDIHLYLQSM